MNRDTVTGLVAAGVLVAAMVGVFFYERNVAIQNGIGQDATGVGPASASGPSLEGTTAVGASKDETLVINQTGLTNVTFTLRWTAGNGVDTMRLAIAPSQATGITTGAESEPETDGEITLTIPITNTAADGALGVGPWQVSVEFVSASTGLPAEPPVPPPGTTDTQVAWTVETTLQTLATPAAAA